MRTCSRCAKTYSDDNRLFCDCGERLKVTSGDDPVREMSAEIARIRTQVVERLNAHERALEQLGIRGQRPMLADPRGADLGLDRGGFADFGELLRTIRFEPSDPRLPDLETRALSATAGASGGFLVPSEFSEQLLGLITQEAVIRPRARVVPSSADHPDASVDMPCLDYSGSKGTLAGVQMHWTGEGSAKTETEPAFASIKLDPRELSGYCVVTDKLLRNSGAGPILGSLFVEAIVRTSEATFFAGNGVGKPLGILGHAATINVVRGGAGIVYEDLIAMLAALKPGSRAIWLASQSTLPDLLSLRLAAGTGNLPIWIPSAREGVPDTLLGRPIFFPEYSPALGTEGDLVLADFSFYGIKDGVGIRADVGHFGDLFKENRSAIRCYMAVDGQPLLTTPIELANGSLVSPFVVLE
ncbi:MAG TPA: phage major capsid protein [Phycisphaerae bacterium]|nr:phage major capsid protein [Phycisphaerae bacterium]